MIDQVTADRYLKDKDLYESGELDLTPEEVQLRRDGLREFGDEVERSQKRKQQIWLERRESTVRRGFTDIDTLGGKFTPDTARQYAWAINLDDIKARVAITDLLAMHNNITPEEADKSYRTLRDKYSLQYHDGKLPKTNVEFWHTEKARIENEERVGKGVLDLKEQAIVASVADGLKDAPPNVAAGFRRWQGGDILTHEIGKAVPKDQLYGEYDRFYKAGFDSVQKFRDVIDAFGYMTNRPEMMTPSKTAPSAEGEEEVLGRSIGMGISDRMTRKATAKAENVGTLREQDISAIAERFITAPKEEQEMFFTAMGLYLSANYPEEDTDTAMRAFVRQLRERAAAEASGVVGERALRMMENGHQNNVLDALQSNRPVWVSREAGGDIKPGDIMTEQDVAKMGGGYYSASPDTFGRPISPGERNEMVGRFKRLDEVYRAGLRLENVRQNMRPLQTVSPFGMPEVVERAAYMVAETAPQMGAVIAGTALGGPALGFAISTHAIRVQEYEQLLLERPEMSHRDAMTAATGSAMIQAAIEQFQVGALMKGGSLLNRISPNVGEAFRRLAVPQSSFWRKAAGRVLVGTGEETLEEGVQGALGVMVKNAILTDYPAASIKEAFWENVSPEVMLASLFMVLPAAGAGSWVESSRVRQGLGSMEQLKWLGFSEEQAQPIIDLARAKQFGEAEKLLQKSYAELTEAQVENGIERVKQSLEAGEALRGEKGFEVRRVREGQYEMVEPDGTVSATFDDADAALGQYLSRAQWDASMQARTMRNYMEWFQKRVDGERISEELHRERVVDEEPEPLDVKKLAASMNAAGITEGDASRLIIKGEALTELVDGIRRDVVRLYRGADFMTVVEEHAHAQLQKDMRDGRFTREQAQQWARDWAQEAGIKLEDPANISDAEIFEVLGDAVKAHFLNERKQIAAPPVRGIAARLRVYLREVFRRAKALIQMREAGKLDADFEGYLDRSIGINEQETHNKAVMEEVVASPSLQTVEVGNPHFSIGVLGEDQKMPWHDPKTAKKWALANLRGKHPNKATNSDFIVNRKTIDHTFDHSNLRGDKIRVLEAIKAIINEARPLKNEKPYDGGQSGVASDQIFYAPVIVDNEFRMARLVVHRMDEAHTGERRVYDVKSVEIGEAQLLLGRHLQKEDIQSDMLRFPIKIDDFDDLVKKAYPNDFLEGPHNSIGHSDYLSEAAKAMDARLTPDERLAFVEKTKNGWKEAGKTHLLLKLFSMRDEQRTREEAKASLKVEQLQRELEGKLETLREEKGKAIEEAGTSSMSKFMDRIEAAKTERERSLLKREARETARDLKQGIEKDFNGREKALKERYKGKEKELWANYVGEDKADQARADAEERAWRVKQSLVYLDRMLMALPPEVRGRVGGFVKLADLKTDAAREKYFLNRFEKADRIFEDYLGKQYDAAFDRLLKRSRAKLKPGQRPQGKLGADIHALFSRVEEARRWTPDELDRYVAGLEADIAKGDLSTEAEAHAMLELGILPMVADWRNADSARKATALDGLKRIFSKGYGDFQLEKAARATARKEMRGRFVLATEKKGSKPERDAWVERNEGLKGVLKDVAVSGSTFEQVMHYIFGEGSEDAQWFADRQREADFRKADLKNALTDRVQGKLEELAGGRYKAQELSWRLSQKSMEVRGLKLSEYEAMTVTLYWRQEDGRRHMMGMRDEHGNVTSTWSYDQAFVDEAESKLSKEGRAMRDFLADEMAKEHALIAPLFRKLHGVDLPMIEFYWPLKVSQALVGGGGELQASVTPGSMKSRGHVVAEPEFKSALEAFMGHKDEIHHWLAYAELYNDARAVLGHRDVRNAVEAKAGPEAGRLLGQWLNRFANDGKMEAASRVAMDRVLGKLASNASAIAIVGRLGVIAVQGTQLMTALAEMPTASYLKRFAMLTTGNLGWGAAMDSSYIQRRLKDFPPAIRIAMEGLKADSPSRLRYAVERLGGFVSGADALFTAGTYAIVYDYRLTKLQEAHPSMPKAELEKLAHFEAERITDRLAQPMRTGAKSMYELNATNPISRVVWSFSSEPRKNLAVVAFALAKRNLTEKARVFAAMMILQPLVSNLIRVAWRDARDSEDDDIFDEKNWNLKRLALATLTEPLQGVPVLGGAAQDAIYNLAGVYQPSGNLFSSIGNAAPALGRLPDMLSGELEARQVLRDVEAILSGMGLFNGQLAAAASLSHLARDLFGVTENVAESAK